MRGWTVLVGVYGRLSRPVDRARALRELIRLSGPTPELLTDLGEALTLAGGDIVPAKARQLFEQALQGKPDYVKASFYLAIAQEQEGKFEEALARWQKLALTRKDNQQWQTMVLQKMAGLRSNLGLPQLESLPGPTAEDVANAATLSSTERTDMIKSMVAGLATKLEENPGDLAGWNRLVRSYVVLGQKDDAMLALRRARTVFADQPDNLARLNEQAVTLDLPESLPEGQRP